MWRYGVHAAVINEFNARSREIFKSLVETYFETGEPVGSRTLSRRIELSLSPATIRNVMADLEEMGLLYAPHTSAGRLPTDRGLKLFVDGLLEVGDLTEQEQRTIEAQLAGNGRSFNEVLSQATEMLSGLTHTAGLVFAPKVEAPLKHMEFIYLGPRQALVVLVSEGGLVENRLIDLPVGMTPSALTEASNYLNARLSGRMLDEVCRVVRADLEAHTAELDSLASQVVEAGVATWSGENGEGRLIIRGRANLLDDVEAVADLERLRGLFDSLETGQNLLRLLESTEGGQGVHVYIGAESTLFDLTGCSMIVSPLNSADSPSRRCVGAIGVIGPTRLNYARIIPMVDFTAKTIARLIGGTT